MGLENVPRQRLAGLWTPTLTIVATLDAVTLNRAFYSVSGNLVSCFLSVQCDPSSTAEWRFRVSLPIATPLAAIGDIAGAGGILGSAGFGAGVVADVANDEALCFGAHSAAEETATFSFGYLVGP